MMKCRNVEQAIRKNFQYHNLVTDIIRPNMKVETALVYLTWEMGHPSLAPDRHLSESILALFVSMLRFLTGDQFKLTEVRFSHPPPENSAMSLSTRPAPAFTPPVNWGERSFPTTTPPCEAPSPSAAGCKLLWTMVVFYCRLIGSGPRRFLCGVCRQS